MRVRRITMDQMTRRVFSAAGFALLLATSATFAQQQPSTVRVRGTVEGGDGPILTVKSRDGQTTYKVRMAETTQQTAAWGRPRYPISRRNRSSASPACRRPTAARRRSKFTFSRRPCAVLARGIVRGT